MHDATFVKACALVVCFCPLGYPSRYVRCLWDSNYVVREVVCTYLSVSISKIRRACFKERAIEGILYHLPPCPQNYGSLGHACGYAPTVQR